MPQESLKTILCMVLVVVLGVGCTEPAMQSRALEPTPTQPTTSAIPETLTASVTIHGALREIMHMGRTERRVDLAALDGQKGLFGYV